MMPYILRLEHLAMDWLWEGPRKDPIEAWLARSRTRPNYRGISDYLDAKYIQLAKEKGEEGATRLKDLFHAVRN